MIRGELRDALDLQQIEIIPFGLLHGGLLAHSRTAVVAAATVAYPTESDPRRAILIVRVSEARDAFRLARRRRPLQT